MKAVEKNRETYKREIFDFTLTPDETGTLLALGGSR